jgi:hypothetical protein
LFVTKWIFTHFFISDTWNGYMSSFGLYWGVNSI